MTKRIICPLCRETSCSHLFNDRRRDYYECSSCRLIHVPHVYFASQSQQKQRYDLHRNSIDDAGYVSHLMRIVTPLVSALAKGTSGLDYGSGPNPVLSALLSEKGFLMSQYDVFYAPERGVRENKYDFVVSAETVEHFENPFDEWHRIINLVPCGMVAIMTKMVSDLEAFKKWRYINDITHVCFYSRDTFKWIGRKFGIPVRFPAKDVVFYTTGDANK